MNWSGTMLNMLCHAAMEISFMGYLVYGWQHEEKVHPKGSLFILAVLYMAGVAVHFAAFCFRERGEGVYIIMLSQALFYYAVLIFYLKINWRLSVYYMVVFDIPIDICDLIVFVAMLRAGGVDVSSRQAETLHVLLYMLVSFLLGLLMLTLIRHFLDADTWRTLGNMQLLLIALSVLPFLYMRNLGFWLPLANDDIGYTSIVFLAVTGLITLILVIGNERIVYFHIQSNELLKMQQLISHQHEQYEMRKEAVDLVNQKYHDIRHQLVAILGMEGAKEIHAYVNSLQKEIKPFENYFRTGSQLLDIILTDKAEECRKKNIELIPAADGEALSILEAADLCTIFGNALDNAIEGCEKAEEKSRRYIVLKVCKVQGFLVIYVENPCSRRVCAKAGRFLTTKPDRENHGYGLQGIRQAAEKYQGEMETETASSLFTLTLLIPLASS